MTAAVLIGVALTVAGATAFTTGAIVYDFLAGTSGKTLILIGHTVASADRRIGVRARIGKLTTFADSMVRAARHAGLRPIETNEAGRTSHILRPAAEWIAGAILAVKSAKDREYSCV